MKKPRMVRIHGREMSVADAGRAFIAAWEASQQAHLKELIFRVPVVEGEYDLNLLLTNEMAYRIFKMPKVGIRVSFAEAIKERGDACFDGKELVSFEPVEEDLVDWAIRNGRYIEFDEIEVVDEACKKAG